MITERDLELLRTLAFCPLLDARQIMKLDLPGPEYTNLSHLMEEERHNKLRLADRGFANYERCRQNLYRLVKKGFLQRYTYSPTQLTMWGLSPEGHPNIVHDRLWLEKTHDLELPHNGYQPDPSRALHHKAVCDIFVAIQPRLTALYGPLPAWEWMSERRAFDPYFVGTDRRRYMPDAEIVLGDEDIVFVLEHQTRFARKTDAEIHKKIERHHERLTGNRGLGEDEFQVLFSCDEPRDMDYAHQAGRDLGVDVVAGYPQVIVQHIREVASAHSKRTALPNHSYEAATETSRTAASTHPPQSPQTDLDLDLENLTEIPF